MPLPFSELPYTESLLLDRDTVVEIAEENHLAITIRPDGTIYGLPSDLERLRTLTGLDETGFDAEPSENWDAHRAITDAERYAA